MTILPPPTQTHPATPPTKHRDRDRQSATRHPAHPPTHAHPVTHPAPTHPPPGSPDGPISGGWSSVFFLARGHRPSTRPSFFPCSPCAPGWRDPGGLAVRGPPTHCERAQCGKSEPRQQRRTRAPSLPSPPAGPPMRRAPRRSALGRHSRPTSRRSHACIPLPPPPKKGPEKVSKLFGPVGHRLFWGKTCSTPETPRPHCFRASAPRVARPAWGARGADA